MVGDHPRRHDQQAPTAGDKGHLSPGEQTAVAALQQREYKKEDHAVNDIGRLDRCNRPGRNPQQQRLQPRALCESLGVRRD